MKLTFEKESHPDFPTNVNVYHGKKLVGTISAHYQQCEDKTWSFIPVGDSVWFPKKLGQFRETHGHRTLEGCKDIVREMLHSRYYHWSFIGEFQQGQRPVAL